jgi:transposase
LEHTPQALRALAAKSRDANQARRLLAIALILEGICRAQAAQQTGMDRQTLRDWVSCMRHYGTGCFSAPDRM